MSVMSAVRRSDRAVMQPRLKTPSATCAGLEGFKTYTLVTATFNDMKHKM